MQLAKARPAIEAENSKRASLSQPELSIRAALALLRSARSKQPGSPRTNKAAAVTLEDVLTWLQAAATTEERRQVALELAKDTAVALRVMGQFTLDGGPVLH